MAGLTLSEIEDRAKRVIRSACPAEMLEIECLTTDRETGRVFVVLRCKEVKNKTEDRS
jgi:hypothetical protein